MRFHAAAFLCIFKRPGALNTGAIAELATHSRLSSSCKHVCTLITMKPFLGGMYFAVALRSVDQNDAPTANTYLRLTADVLSNTPERHQTVAEMAALWAMQHARETRASAIANAVDAMTLLPAWYAEVIPSFLGGVHVAWAFEDYAAGRWRSVESHALKGLMHNPRAIRNRGVLSIMARALFQRQRAQPASHSPDDADAAAHLSSATQRIERTIGKPVQRLTDLSHPYSVDRIYRAEVEGGTLAVRMSRQGEVAQPGYLLALARSAGLPVPALIADVPASATQPGMSIEQFIEGQALKISDASDLARWEEPLCDLMRRLHQAPVTAFGTLSPAGDHAFHRTHQDWLAALQLSIQMACITDAVPLQVLPLLDQAMTQLTRWPYAGMPRLIHCDLNDSNILVHDNVICGIIDWANAEGNDPARDLGIFLMNTADAWHMRERADFPAHFVRAYLQGWDEIFYLKVIAHMILHSAMCLQWSRLNDDEPTARILTALLANAPALHEA